MDEERFRSFYERTARPLRSYLARVSGDPSLADEMLQEAYYRFLRARLAEDDEGYLRNYLYRIATNLMRDHWRDHRKRGATFQPASEPADISPERDSAERLHQRADLDRAFSRLKPREREILWLAYVNGSSHKEIAKVLGVRSGSIRLMLFRSRRKLAALLGGTKAGLRKSPAERPLEGRNASWLEHDDGCSRTRS